MIELEYQDPDFTGTAYAASTRMIGVGKRQLQNLIEGRTHPWKVTAYTMFEILKVFRGCGLTLQDFKRPRWWTPDNG